MTARPVGPAVLRGALHAWHEETTLKLAARTARFLMIFLPATILAQPVAAQVLETETARPLAPRTVSLGSAYEFQTSSEGREAATPVAIEYGVTRRLGLMVEPVVSTAIRPNVAR